MNNSEGNAGGGEKTEVSVNQEKKVKVPIFSGMTGSPLIHRIFGAVVLIQSIIVYYATTCPVIYYGDAGEFIVAAKNWGIAHPPGYPIYTILLGIFLRLPLGFLAPDTEFIQATAWQANFFSAVLGAFAIWIIYLILLRLTRNPYYALPGALLCMTSRTFWSQTGIAEVYTLNALLAAIIVLLALQMSEARRGSLHRVRLMRWGSLVWGLSLCNHQEMVFFFPVWLTMLILALQVPENKKRHEIPQGRIFLEAIGFFIIGLLPYIYLPIASSRDPVLNWGNPSTLKGFFNVLTRAEYRGIKAGITGDLVTSWDIFLTYLYWSSIQYFPVFITSILGLAGFVSLFRKLKHSPALISSAISLFLMAAVFIIYFAKIDRPSMFFLEVYFIPWYLSLGVLVTLGIKHVTDILIAKNLEREILIMSFGLIFLVGFVWVTYSQNKTSSNMSDNIAGYIYSHDVIASLPDRPDKSILVTGGDEIFLIWYWKWVEGVDKNIAAIGYDALGIRSSWFWDDLTRDDPDIIIPDIANIPDEIKSYDQLRLYRLEMLLRENFGNYRTYMTSWDPAFDPIIHEKPWHMVVDGPVLELEKDTENNFTDYPRASTPEEDYLFRNLLDVDRAGLVPFEIEVYQRYASTCFNLATYFERAGDYQRAIEFAKLCMEFQPGFSAGDRAATPEAIIARNLINSEDWELARDLLTDLLANDPNNAFFHYSLAETYVALKDPEKALDEFERAIQLDPDNAFIKQRYNEVINSLLLPDE
ncbi:MAG TPA: DUF2723 domain-containing protein [bacterium]|jgi:tetratricopeptide (TPR) repeat protein